VVRERTHRNTAESTNSRVKWWSIFQLGVLIGEGIFQVWWLKRFFEVSISLGGIPPPLASSADLLCRLNALYDSESCMKNVELERRKIEESWSAAEVSDRQCPIPFTFPVSIHPVMHCDSEDHSWRT